MRSPLVWVLAGRSSCLRAGYCLGVQHTMGPGFAMGLTGGDGGFGQKGSLVVQGQGLQPGAWGASNTECHGAMGHVCSPESDLHDCLPFPNRARAVLGQTPSLPVGQLGSPACGTVPRDSCQRDWVFCPPLLLTCCALEELPDRCGHLRLAWAGPSTGCTRQRTRPVQSESSRSRVDDVGRAGAALAGSIGASLGR